MTSEAAVKAGQLVHVIQGGCEVSSDPNLVLTTTLGSCIAACLHDPRAGVGGMNHFLLPEAESCDASESLRYGAYAMELLVNGLLRAGARRERLEARLFGGGMLTPGLTDIGAENAAFAQAYLDREGVRIAGGSLGGRFARRIQFWPATGRARQLVLRIDIKSVEPQRTRLPLPKDSGTVELF